MSKLKILKIVIVLFVVCILSISAILIYRFYNPPYIGSAQQIVGVFDAVPDGNNLVMVITRWGNIGNRIPITALPEVYRYSFPKLNGLLGTGSNWSGTTTGSTSVVTFDTSFPITAELLKVAVIVDTSAAQAGDTFWVCVGEETKGFASISPVCADTFRY